MLWLILIVLAAWWFMRKPSQSDETIIQRVIRENPSLSPVNTVSIDDGEARMVFFDRATLSGRVIDAN